MGENISQNITKQSEQTSGSLCNELKEVATNAQELAILQEMNSAENLENSAAILELAKIQDKCISACFVNTASLVNMKETQKDLKNEITASFELLRKGQEELNLMMATFINQNYESRINSNSPGESSSGKQFNTISIATLCQIPYCGYD